MLWIKDSFLIDLLSNVYPLYKSFVNNLCLILLGFFALVMHRYRWTGFLIGIISSSLITSTSLILECVIPNGDCSSENLEMGTHQMFILFNFFYSLLILIMISIVKNLLRTIRS
jgi:hypothetical protein